MMQNHETFERKLPAIIHALLYAVVWFLWDKFVAGGALLAIKDGVTDMVGDIVFVEMALYLALDVASTCLMLLVMHKLVFFSKKHVSVLYPLMTCLAVSTAARYAVSFVQQQLNRVVLWEMQAVIRPYAEPCFLTAEIILPALMWAVIVSAVGEPKHQSRDARLSVQSACVIVALLSGASYFLMQLCLYTVTLMDAMITIFQWQWLLGFFGLMLALLKGVYGFGKKLAAADENQESTAVFVGKDEMDRPVIREEEPKRRGSAKWRDFENEERVIAQSSREAIRVMEHHELEMEHEWNCDDDQKGHSK